MADNRRAGDRTLFRGDVEGNDTLAEISRALETERRAPMAVGAGFIPPVGGQASNIPAMADLEDELLREFALYEGPRETSAREPARKIEPSFEAVARPHVAAPAKAPVAAHAPASFADDEDDTMPPMDIGSIFRAARPQPIVRTPVAAAPVVEPARAEPARVEPELPAVIASEPDSDIDMVPESPAVEMQEAAVDQPVSFSGPVPDLADWDMDEVDPSADVAEEPEFETLAAEEAEPVFAGPVPDLDFAEEPVFAGPVPELELDDSVLQVEELAFAGPVPDIDLDFADEPEDEPSFAGPVPDFDFDEPEVEAAAVAADVAQVDEDREGELEQSLGALDLTPETAVEPASPYAAWKNDRLSAGETTTPAWLSAPVRAPQWIAPVDEVSAAEDHSLQAGTARYEDTSHGDDAVEAADMGDDLLADFDLDLSADDLGAPDIEASDTQSRYEGVAPNIDEPFAPQVKAAIAEPVRAVVSEPDLSVFAVKPAAMAAAVTPVPDRFVEMPDWLQASRKNDAAVVAPPETKVDPDLQDFEFDFDEDAIEAEVSRAVMSELQSGVKPQPIEEMPFDPSAITEIEDAMPASFGNMDVPQVPEHDSDAPPKPVSDFDYDIEAEMAELFAMGSKSRAQDASNNRPDAQPEGEGDGLDNGLANEIIRSIHESPAIPAGRAFDMADVNASSTSFVSRYARIAAFAALVAFAGVGAVLLWRSGDVPGMAGTDGAPRVIMADKSPIKEVPDQPGGKQVPNQDKAVYDRVAGKSAEVVKQGSLIANSEEPVNVAEKTLGDDASMPPEAQVPGVSDASATNDADARLPATPSQPGTNGQQSNESVAPRKVKTMIVLPNGTLVARETPAPAEPSAAQKPTGADAPMTAPAATAKVEASQPGATLVPPGSAVPGQQAAADKTAQPKPVAAPIPTARPVDQPVNVVGTVTKGGNVVGQQPQAAEKPAAQVAQAAAPKPAQQPAAAPVASSVPAGAYVIQIASLPTQEEAQKSYSNLSAKFSSVIGGKSPDIKPAEIPGKGTFYRLRIVAGSKDDAIALCTRYKAAGGSCLVSR